MKISPISLANVKKVGKMNVAHSGGSECAIPVRQK